MNEGISVYLNLDKMTDEEAEKLIKRIDELLLNFGMKYSGLANIYVPVDKEKRDQAVYMASLALKEVPWLQGIYNRVLVNHWTNACGLNQIKTEHMSEPENEKMNRYENYYKVTGRLPHGIVVNEDNEIMDGYIAYLLAKKYGLEAEIYQCVKEEPIKKVVIGRHVALEKGVWKVKSDKYYRWVYNLKKAVVRGDILLAETDKGLAYMQVESIEYVAGSRQCSEYRQIRRHTDCCRAE